MQSTPPCRKVCLRRIGPNPFYKKLILKISKDNSKCTRIEVFANVLQQTGLTELDRVLDEFEIVWVGVLQLKQNFVTTRALVEMISLNFPLIPNLYCHQVVLLLHVLHPLGGLTLRVDHQSPSKKKM